MTTMSVAKAAELLRVTRSRVYQLIHLQKISLYQGRPTIVSVEAYKDSRLPKGRPEGTFKKI